MSPSPITPALISRVVDRYAVLFPLLLVCFSAFDVLSTYLGVCLLGGTEINAAMSLLIQSVGFAPVGLAHNLVFLGLGLWAWWSVTRKIRSPNFKLLALAMLFFIAVAFYGGVLLNNGWLIYKLAAEQASPGLEVPGPPTAELTRIPQESIDYAVSVFDRSLFCRLVA